MILPIYLYGSEVLRKVAEPVAPEEREEITRLVGDMKETLKKSEGCGLAAPQVGVSKRLLIVDGRDMVDVYPYLDGFVRVMINPVVVWESDRKSEYSEGCLSIPNIYCDIVRPESITVEYLDENFGKVTETFDKFACRMVQHEMSHLDGDLFIDHVAPVRRKIISRKLSSIKAGKVSLRYPSKIK
ncbi:MAG: peptide deformylase [Candidatus Cryptobacteroides sp.]